MAKDEKCKGCGSFLNRMGVCLNCFPPVKQRPSGKKERTRK